ncbi:von Willebrand factor type A [Pirellula staleyi DSM 6068]|uniref:von Willebrand factor type A n=1 Tax=Pirellula staleyi (strain ATCC 27377 / DSM 6068 / ICPB 4128) TaxID=530564 RepID=D2R1T3_PIRSD|nr:glutamine amidotransferase [Pirellula staleyi]ADB16802.1 von Willebrand factor type A [Pirellula staleyi DSM 6068]
MGNYNITFDDPWLLLLLLALPLIWIYSFRSLSGLGPYRRIFALSLRSLVLTALVLALAGVQLQKTTDRMTVLYLLDQSESIPKRTREAMLEYVTRDVAVHRRTGDLQNPVEDKAGIIIFGREATIEYPPFADEIRASGVLESLFELRTDATNIAAALKLASASFPEDSAKRIVIVTDGNENLGDARSVAKSLTDNGIGIDVVPIKLSSTAEVAVEKISLPPDIRRGQPLEARVVVENFTKPTKDNPTAEVAGRLRVQRTFGGTTEAIGEKDLEVTLKPGKNVFAFQHTIDVPAGYTYSAEFFPDDAAFDLQQQNNKATSFTHVRGKGRVLLIEDWESRGEFAFLVQRLGEMNIEVDVQPSDRLFTSLAELQGYDCVVMANVPRASGGETDNKEATNFSDEQISMLVRNTEQFGCGLVMLGGPNSFGAGGWANTELEKAMPVDFQIKNEKVKAVGALVMMMHASELAQGNYWQKVIGQEALKVLGPSDYCGCVHWDDFTGRDNWLWRDGAGKGLVRIGGQQKSMLGRLDRMAPGDMPQFEPAMTMALKDLKPNPASVKHMIIISDGDPSPPSGTILNQYKQAGIKITTVAVGTHGPAGSTPLQNIANATGGKYYVATNPKALPRIFQIEARRVARPLVYEDPAGFSPGIIDPTHEMMQNIGTTLPPIKGYVLTTVKENPLVEVLARSPKPGAGPENSTLLASWTYGAGKTAVFTSDAGQRWANSWTEWENYDKFYSQMIRWAMRPVNEDGKFSVATDVKDGKVRVVVTALDKDDEFLNFLNMSGAGTGPEMENVQLSLKQEAPGRYVGEFPADKAGSYLLAISPGSGKVPILAGVNVPYSAEFRERESNRALLDNLAKLKPKDGEVGTVLPTELEPSEVNSLVAALDTFRRTLARAISIEDVWPPLLVLAAALFLFDVFVRRVTVHFYWIAPALKNLWRRMRGQQLEAVADERMERLRGRKAAISQQMEDRRAASRFEPSPDAPVEGRDLDTVLGDATLASDRPVAASPEKTPTATPETKDADSYTERLLAAKKKAKRDGK